ncbi:MAG: hypothetical protein U0T77_10805 [Chitinophagales bacterium]
MPLSDNIYNVNWNRFAIWQTPIDLRKIKLIRYLLVLLEPVKSAHNEFKQFRLQQLYEAEINGQTIKLERVLNDTFDPVERRIYITDGEYYNPPVYYEEYKNDPVIYYEEGNGDNPIFWSDTAIDNRVSFNFYVNVPSSVFFQKTRVKALVSKYKIAGRTFEVILIP